MEDSNSLLYGICFVDRCQGSNRSKPKLQVFLRLIRLCSPENCTWTQLYPLRCKIDVRFCVYMSE